ncbi:LOW QUALITY PROTEIN: hypothetical protein OSB04_008444, partial [Centaurea solstitialis]
MFTLAGKLLLWFSFVFICLIDTTTVAQPEFVSFDCVESVNFTRNGTYERNLDANLATLPATNSGFGFFNRSIGQGTDRVNSIALCRGDLEPAVCRSCLNDSIVKLRDICPNQKEAIGYYDNCMLKYSNQTILGNTGIRFFVFMLDPLNYLWDKDGYNITMLLSPLMAETRSRCWWPLLKFATGKTNGPPDLPTLYVLQQCTPELTEQQCSGCLADAIDEFSNWESGKAGGRSLLPMCNIRYAIYQFYKKTTLLVSPPPSSSSPPIRSSPVKKNDATRTIRPVMVVILVVIVVLVIIFTLLCIYIRLRTKKQKLIKNKNNKSETMDLGTMESLRYNFSAVRVATNDFSENNKLGEGGFEAVYKGTFEDGQEIAVKRLARDSGQGDLEFQNEVMLLAKLQHRNLVRLLGFSLEGSERVLIYEFMSNASLDQFIFDPVKRMVLDWEKRYEIIRGVAKGLLYLHEDSRLRIIHRDMKVSNILLDDELNPKIADFGTARLFNPTETQGNTNRIVGTYGYMAPEYAMHGQFSVKSDVFSFGVFVLEMVTGQKNQCFRNGESIEDFLSFAWKSWQDGTTLDMIDPMLKASASSWPNIIRSIHIGLLCVQENVVDRPTMAAVGLLLNSSSLVLPLPSKPAFFMPSSIHPEILRSRSSLFSINDASISVM